MWSSATCDSGARAREPSSIKPQRSRAGTPSGSSRPAPAPWPGGAFVYVPRGVEVELPLRYVTLGGQPGAPLLNHMLVIAEEDSGVSVDP